MRVRVSSAEIRRALNDDSEYRLQARYWDGVLQLEFGDEAHVLRLEGGEVVEVGHDPLADQAEPRSVIIRAPHDEWVELLRPIPPPYYQEFYPAMWHHGFELLGDPDYIWPYYAALRRVGEVLRNVATIEVS